MGWLFQRYSIVQLSSPPLSFARWTGRNPPVHGSAGGVRNKEGPCGEVASVVARTGHGASTFVVSTKNADGDTGVAISRRCDSTPFTQPPANTGSGFHNRPLHG